MLIAAFEGWNDAGEAASTTVEFLRGHFAARPFAEIEAEDFFDFTQNRPNIVFDSNGIRQIEWPTNRFSAVSGVRAQGGDSTHPSGGSSLDLVLLAGVEPAMRWRTFTSQVMSVCRALDVRLVITLGSLLAEVPHSRPVSVISTAYTTRAARELDVPLSRYQGSSGIVGVLHDACRAAEIDSVGVWATVPSYLPVAPSPKASLALVGRVGELLGIEIPTAELEIASRSYEQQVGELVSDDEETAGYVRELEQRWDSGSAPDSSTSLADEVEKFLREQ